LAASNLTAEGKPPESVYITGNTVIDALKTTVRADYSHELLTWARGSRLILLTAHRRENIGEPMRGMFRAIKRVTQEHNDVKVIYPVHPNPVVRETAAEVFEGCESVRIVEPLGVVDFHNFLSRCCFVLTDSGGIQEEATCLGKPVLVMRKVSERPEGIAAGTLKLVGNDEDAVYNSFSLLLDDESEYRKMCAAENVYGDGHASERIADILSGV